MTLLFRKGIASIFLDTQSEGYTLLLYVILCIASGVLCNAVIYTKVRYLQAVEKVREAQHLESVSNLTSFLFFAVLLSDVFGIKGIFLAFPISKAVVLGISLIRYHMKSGKIFPSVRERLELEEAFFSSEKDIISYSFGNIEECVISSEQIQLFCKGHGLPKRTAFMAALCAEEIMTNIIMHGGGTSRKNTISGLRVTIADQAIVMCIKDDGKSFNMNALAKMLSQEKKRFENLGLKIICASAKEISYYRIYGMNTTILKIQ